MFEKYYRNILAVREAENRILRLGLFLVILSNLWLGWYVYRATRQHVVVFQPVGYCQKFKVGTRTPDRTYLLVMARFIVDSLLNYTPSTVRKQYEAVLALFDPSTYERYKKLYADFVDEAETASLTSTFTIYSIKVSDRRPEIHVRGRRVLYLRDSPVKQADETYMIRYRYDYGTFRIVEVKKIEKRGG